MALVCVDTNILIWGVKKTATPGQEHMIDRAQRFLAILRVSDNIILVPDIVVGEYLLNIDPSDHRSHVLYLQDEFAIAPYNTLAARHFARIWHANTTSGLLTELKQQDNPYISRRMLRADCMIIATAMAAGASELYSHDPGLRKFAENHIKAFDLPDIPINGTKTDQDS